MNAQAISALQSLKSWDSASTQQNNAPKRQTNRELLDLSRSTTVTKAEQNQAAEQLRRQVKALCGAHLARQNRALSASELEDLTQDVILRLLQSPEGTEPSSAYIARIATNLLIDRQRHLVRRGQEKFTLSLDDTIEGETRDILDPAARVEDTVLARIQQLSLRKALATFLKPTEATIVLRRAEGASHDEIAEELGLTCANVRKQAERGMKRLKLCADAGQFAY
jgi:RNA polymerase sigma factor (sigma-70 family)